MRARRASLTPRWRSEPQDAGACSSDPVLSLHPLPMAAGPPQQSPEEASSPPCYSGGLSGAQLVARTKNREFKHRNPRPILSIQHDPGPERLRAEGCSCQQRWCPEHSGLAPCMDRAWAPAWGWEGGEKTHSQGDTAHAGSLLLHDHTGCQGVQKTREAQGHHTGPMPLPGTCSS